MFRPLSGNTKDENYLTSFKTFHLWMGLGYKCSMNEMCDCGGAAVEDFETHLPNKGPVYHLHLLKQSEALPQCHI